MAVVVDEMLRGSAKVSRALNIKTLIINVCNLLQLRKGLWSVRNFKDLPNLF